MCNIIIIHLTCLPALSGHARSWNRPNLPARSLRDEARSQNQPNPALHTLSMGGPGGGSFRLCAEACVPPEFYLLDPCAERAVWAELKRKIGWPGRVVICGRAGGREHKYLSGKRQAAFMTSNFA